MSSSEFPIYDYGDDSWKSQEEYEASQELYQDETFERFRILTEIGGNADELITKLKTERAPDFADNTFLFNEEQIATAFPYIPRIVDVLLAYQYSLKELSVSFKRDHMKSAHAIEVTFGLSDKHDPDGELHTLVARREDLRSPHDNLADTFTYPASPQNPQEESMRFPTLSSSDLRKLVASLMPLDNQSSYELYDDWIQDPEHFETIVDSFTMQDCTQIIDSGYKLFSPIGEKLGTFTYSTFDGDLIGIELEVPEDDAIAKYEVTLGQLPPPEDIEGMNEFDEFFGAKPTREVLNNDESPAMVRRFFPERKAHSIPKAADASELALINKLLQNDPSFHPRPEDLRYSRMSDLPEDTPGENIL